MTKQEETQKKQLEKTVEKELSKGMLDGIVYGIEIYKVTSSRIENIPVGKYVELD